ncbi:MAG: AI-2E family transporter [Gammaproteobacteria bacterium]|nr:AI-2E family transporter [Gammaproteobacteria bacterium]
MQIIRKWFDRNFSDPQAVYLAFLLLLGFSVVIFAGAMLLPVFAGIVIAYLLDSIVLFLERRGPRRLRAVALVFLVFLASLIFILFGLMPLLAGQVVDLFRELPVMINRGQEILLQIPQHHPYITEEQIRSLIGTFGQEVRKMGHGLVTTGLSSISDVITLVVYLVLMPLLVFFFLKDKWAILLWFDRYLPKDRDLMARVWKEMDTQLGNYVRGKIWEILIVGTVCVIVFLVLGLQYAVLLGLLVGLSVLVPYIGAVAVTFPVVLVALFQWGWSAEFAWLVAAYLFIQALDGTVLVPLMFSEVNNLHPVAIIVAVLFFGGLWGFWGVFFAIPLATLVQALLSAWPREQGAAIPS